MNLNHHLICTAFAATPYLFAFRDQALCGLSMLCECSVNGLTKPTVSLNNVHKMAKVTQVMATRFEFNDCFIAESLVILLCHCAVV